MTPRQTFFVATPLVFLNISIFVYVKKFALFFYL